MKSVVCSVLLMAIVMSGCSGLKKRLEADRDLDDCVKMAATGFRPVAGERTERFLGKVRKETARCRGGEKAAAFRDSPWVDWSNYWATGNLRSRALGFGSDTRHLDPNGRGIDGALLDLEYQRMELIKFNLFDNSGTYPDFVQGRSGVQGAALKVWDTMRLPKESPFYQAVGGDGPQLCRDELIRFRNLTGICNDLKNPAMGSAGMPFARNVQFEATFPDLGKNELARNRHGDRLGPLAPDPQVISRKLFTRAQSQPERCREGQGLPDDSPDANCDYKKAPFFNVLAAFWIQFMTHDWFSHLEEGHNQSEMTAVGCATQRVNNVETPLTPEEIAKLGCRPDDRMEKPLIAEEGIPPPFSTKGRRFRPAPIKSPETPTPLGGTPLNSMAMMKRQDGGSSAIRAIGPSCCWSGFRSGRRPENRPVICRPLPRAIRSTPPGRDRRRPPFPTTGRSA